MGRFGIGARVRDDDGDEGVIVGKPQKGMREVKYEGNTGDKTWLNGEVIWWRKKRLTLINAPAAQEPTWVPKVGDRVKADAGVFEVGGKSGSIVEFKNDFALVDFDYWTGGHRGKGVGGKDQEGGSHWFVLTKHLSPLPVAEQPAGLWAPVVGKYGKTRDGRKVGPIEDRRGFFAAGGYHYNSTGECGLHGRPRGEAWRSRHDLVAEWVDEPEELEAVEAEVKELLNSTPEPAAPPAKFKVGDRVECVADCDGQYHVGGVYEVSRVYRDFNDEWRIGTVRDDGGSTTNGWVAKHFKPASEPSATPAESFIVARLTSKGQPRPNARPRVHTSLDAANAEAQRLADRLGDEFAVYQRVSVRDVDAGPVPPLTDNLKDVIKDASLLAGAFTWDNTKQRHSFWHSQYEAEQLTPLGRAILRKWIAEAEQPKVAA